MFTDFLEHLEAAEAAVQSFKIVPPADWGRCGQAWTGFYETVVGGLGAGSWGYVANANGGFMGLWWGWRKVEGGELYLQLEEELLCVKVKVTEERRRRDVRGTWTRRIVGDRAALKFRRPQRLGNGTHMTVAHLDGEYRTTGPGGCLDVDATMRLLRSVTAEVATLVDSSMEGP